MLDLRAWETAQSCLSAVIEWSCIRKAVTFLFSCICLAFLSSLSNSSGLDTLSTFFDMMLLATLVKIVAQSSKSEELSD